MKYVNLRLQDDEHARMVAMAESKFMPVTSMLRMLFADHEAKSRAQHSSAPAPKMNKRDQAFAEYHNLMANLPAQWTKELFDSTRKAINELRTQGGNIHHTDMPLPESMVKWNNAQHPNAADPKYASWSIEQLKAEVDATGNSSAQAYLTFKLQRAAGDLQDLDFPED
ncbi:hypothetical protein [Flavobacterium sp.]|jgi:hypothetical protein|uniref:hypothetical protein n=1 Tax=Flavobacterium sp. TaxID=239 RepID=UPI0037C0B658